MQLHSLGDGYIGNVILRCEAALAASLEGRLRTLNIINVISSCFSQSIMGFVSGSG